jgi:hypothetical protein
MKLTFVRSSAGAVLLLACLTVEAGGPVPVRLSNESVRLYPGDCSCGFGLVWTIHFSTFYTEEPIYANGEFAPLPQPAAHSHWSYLVLEDPSMFASTTYAEFNLPTADANANGIPDFFEVDQPVAASSSGTYATIWSPGFGQLNLQWTRGAGSRQGSCLLTMIDPILGEMGPFTHTFELVEGYAGSLTYTPGSNSVTGTISLSRIGQDVLTGPVVLLKSETNRFNLLTFAGGNWTNQTDSFAFGEAQLTREPGQPNLYQGTLQNPGGPYRSWKFFLVDTNDANANGIPDFSDDPITVSPPRRPTLSLSNAQTHLRLSVSGEIGRTHRVEQAGTPNTNWTTLHSFVLTNDPQTVTLPLPAASPTFWRVKAE